MQAQAQPKRTEVSPIDGLPSTQAYLLSINTLFRRPLFLDPEGARAVSRLQRETSIWGRSRCLAWVLMPDRWQGLVVLAAGDALEPLVRRFKSVSARAVEPRFRINGWLWARGYNARALFGHENFVTVARDIVADPVRSGLAKSCGEYPYWNAIWLDAQHSRPEFAGDLLQRRGANTMTG